ncbi:MAG: GyrI-like domain-containing protein [Ancalomicrobiaceae bacterium]|nr:GyrI-like domain-containing protein [Ancalomicrobiaceae bacterium]
MMAVVSIILSLPALFIAAHCAFAAPSVSLAPSPTPIGLDSPDAAALPKPPIVPETVQLQPRPVLFVTGESKWDDAEEKLGSAFHAVYGEIGRLNLRTSGVPMVEYTDSDDEKFSYKAMVPIEAKPTEDLADEVRVGAGPAGKVLKFVHQGSFDGLEQVYNRIDDYLAANHLTMKRVVEEYQTDRAKTPPEKRITNIYVFTE